MEIVTLEYVIKYGDKKECVVLYFKDKQSAEKYKEDYLEDDPNITFEDDAIGFQYYNDDEWYSEINDMIVDQAWGRLNPPVGPAERVVERVVEKVVEPEFYKVKYTNIFDVSVCKLLRSVEDAKNYMADIIGGAVGPVSIVKMSLDQLVEEYENA